MWERESSENINAILSGVSEMRIDWACYECIDLPWNWLIYFSVVFTSTLAFIICFFLMEIWQLETRITGTDHCIYSLIESFLSVCKTISRLTKKYVSLCSKDSYKVDYCYQENETTGLIVRKEIKLVKTHFIQGNKREPGLAIHNVEMLSMAEERGDSISLSVYETKKSW